GGGTGGGGGGNGGGGVAGGGGTGGTGGGGTGGSGGGTPVCYPGNCTNGCCDPMSLPVCQGYDPNHCLKPGNPPGSSCVVCAANQTCSWVPQCGAMGWPCCH